MSPEQLDRLSGYWARTMGLFLGKPVVVVLVDGRRRQGMLSGDGSGRFTVWTKQGPAAVPLGLVVSVEQA